MKKYIFMCGFILTASFAGSSTAEASHAWGDYHWGRTTSSFILLLGDNVSGVWDTHLPITSTDWNKSVVIDTQIVAGNTNNVRGRNTPKSCTATSGRAEVCNASYGSTGWLGIATIWASGSHITAGTVKLNDTYYNTATYNTPAWRNLVMCQEVGHIFGLGHQDEVFDNANLDTCMDYSNNPESNQHPNTHDYSMLQTMYAHLDATPTISLTTARLLQDSNNVSDWGTEVHRSANGRSSLFVKDLGSGNKVMRHVYWAQPR